MSNFFLKLKHWQLFLIVFAMPLILYFINLYPMVLKIKEKTQNIQEIVEFLKLFSIIILFVITLQWFWYWSVGVVIQKRIPEELKRKTFLFKFFLITSFLILFATLILLNAFASANFSGAEVDGFNLHLNANNGLINFLLPFFLLHLLYFVCIIYMLIHVSKTIKLAELQKPVKGDDYIGEFFLLWFFPVGLWILQPRINKMVSEIEADNAEQGL